MPYEETEANSQTTIPILVNGGHISRLLIALNQHCMSSQSIDLTSSRFPTVLETRIPLIHPPRSMLLMGLFLGLYYKFSH
jgi:hypothetical protein